MKLLSKARRPTIIGRRSDRRPAMSPNEILAEMPLQLRNIHYLGGGLSTNAPTPTKHDKWNEGGYVVKSSTRQRGHRRQNAIVWDDLASIIRLEVMSAERKLNGTSSTCCQQQTIAPSSTHIEQPVHPASNINKRTQIQKKSSKCSRGSAHRMWEQTEESSIAATSASWLASWNITEVAMDQRDDVAAARDIEQGSSRDITTPHSISTAVTPPEECAVSSPPKVKRMAAFCFDSSSNGYEQMTQAFGRVLQSLSPPPIKRSIPSFSFDNLILMGYDKAQFDYEESTLKRCDTYFSSDDEEEDDGDDTSSLEYSINDDDSDAVERAIIASAAFPVPKAVILSGGCNMPFQCPICLDCTDSSNIAAVSGCAHNFCFKCVDEWAERKNKCPLCKETIRWAASCKRVRWY